jgi:deoxyadenosine/deoxycytidine kinase
MPGLKFVVDGNIGSGKTTQLNLLEAKGYRVKREPIEDWPLELYYTDPARWGLSFQLTVLQSHSQLIDDPNLCIYERYPGSGTRVFWPLMEKTAGEDSVYKHAFELQGWEPDIFIWINTPPTKCYENITRREQSGDKSVSTDYLEQLHLKYEEMFEKLDCTKFKINGDQSIEKVHEEIMKIIIELI